MYTLSLLLLTLFSLYIGVFAFFRWDASFLRNMNHAPVQALFILAFAVLLAAALLLLLRLLNRLSERNLKRAALLLFLILGLGQLLFLAATGRCCARSPENLRYGCGNAADPYHLRHL